MTVQAARKGGIQVCATVGGSYVALDCTSIKPARGWLGSSERADITLIGDEASRSVATGFKDLGLVVTAPRDASHAAWIIIDAVGDGDIYVKYSRDGSTFSDPCQMSVTIDPGTQQAGAGAQVDTLNFAASGGTAP